MSRQPYAMTTLIEQIASKYEDVAANAAEVDGFDVYRTVRFDEDTSAALVEGAVDGIEADPRVASVEVESDGRLKVSFVIDSRADHPHPFHLPATTEADEAEEEADEAEERKAARRRELQDTPVDDLREEFGFEKSHKKPEIVNTILADEFGD